MCQKYENGIDFEINKWPKSVKTKLIKNNHKNYEKNQKITQKT